MKKIGLIGMGLVGKAFIKRFMAANYQVIGYDINQEAANAARKVGVVVGNSPANIAKQCELIFLSLPNSNIVNQVIWGENGLAEFCSHNSTIIDTTTSDPQETIQHYQRLKLQKIRFIDCPLVGSSQEISEVKGISLVGDIEAKAVDYIPLLKTFSKKIFFLGEIGQGHQTKLVVNLVLGLNRIVLSESLGLAKKCGMDLFQILEILKSSAAYSEVMDTQGEIMLKQSFENPVARLAQHAKDVGLILKLAAEKEARVPLSELHDCLLKEAIKSNWGALDNSAVINLFIPPN
ncbi:MAG: NAD(P)-dependent oxidoreductase [Okeania sp. SIO3B5]|uniref:NAD(P)-dependent oxidoreductase n=1 Tax=Okeania sp. SIO3B5 TaxID=2607811 RepID=UPI001400E760|nr:NAD(P)-dependent oxidoreductase [Okeania sp. SIO3B5]NEO55961.1 NAD(P)-dependent oxidoreductase [Okeania sp. SIO3B5]